jgi:ribosomal-protein-alanine N-acetyltransferase
MTAMSSPPPRPVPELAHLSLVIETPRLVLRPIARTDVDALWPYVSDPELPKMMSWDAHRDRGETAAFVERNVDGLARGTDVTWMIVRGGEVIGCISLGEIRWQFRAWRIDRAELGYWLGRPHWGQGVMSEAALAATQWGFETLGLHKITIGCVEGNAASQRIIEKLGYRFLAIHEEDFWRDGRWQAHRRYELTSAEWADAARTLRFSRPSQP